MKKREIMHYYQFHIGDYKSHTHHLSQMEDLAFRRLLDHYYLHEQPIKQRDIARQIGMREHEQDVLTVLNEFFVSTEDGFINPRADDEIAKYRKFIEDGKRGAAKRWLKGGDGEGNSPPIATPIATINHNPLTNNHKPKRESATVVATPVGVSEIVWQDFVKQRKAKKAAVTQTVIDGIQREANKADWTLDAALAECVVRGWQSFKAEWVAPKPTFAQQAADVARTTVPAQHTGRDPVLLKIDSDRKNAAPMPEHIRQQINQVLRKV
jgi:uncharacterized protein YdaU (DUF1376 family)